MRVSDEATTYVGLKNIVINLPRFHITKSFGGTIWLKVVGAGCSSFSRIVRRCCRTLFRSFVNLKNWCCKNLSHTFFIESVITVGHEYMRFYVKGTAAVFRIR